MNCKNCQKNLPETARFCPYCQTAVTRLVSSGLSGTASTPERSASDTGKLFGTLSLVTSIIGLLFLPVIFGPAGIILGIFGLHYKKQNGLALTGAVIGGIEVLLVGINLMMLLSQVE